MSNNVDKQKAMKFLVDVFKEVSILSLACKHMLRYYPTDKRDELKQKWEKSPVFRNADIKFKDNFDEEMEVCYLYIIRNFNRSRLTKQERFELWEQIDDIYYKYVGETTAILMDKETLNEYNCIRFDSKEISKFIKQRHIDIKQKIENELYLPEVDADGRTNTDLHADLFSVIVDNPDDMFDNCYKPHNIAWMLQVIKAVRIAVYKTLEMENRDNLNL